VALNWVLVIAGAVLILVEIILGAVTGFDFVLIGSSVMLGGILGLLTKSATLGMAAAGVLALLYVFLGRKRIRSRLMRPGISSNTDVILGKTARVVETITAARAGRIKFEGEEWRAALDRPETGSIDLGRTVRVVRIDGVTAFVEVVAS
jgi:membrane protein implicated in regulation of membrane protease activity